MSPQSSPSRGATGSHRAPPVPPEVAPSARMNKSELRRRLAGKPSSRGLLSGRGATCGAGRCDCAWMAAPAGTGSQ